MAFSKETTKQAWNRAGGKCENCGTLLAWGSRGAEGIMGWETHHRHSVATGGGDGLGNCQILCQRCHKKTHTYGG